MRPELRVRFRAKSCSIGLTSNGFAPANPTRREIPVPLILSFTCVQSPQESHNPLSAVPCSFVGVTFAFLFVESRVFSSLLHAERLEHFIHALNILHNAILAANSKADIQRIDQRELCNTRRNEKLFRRIQFQADITHLLKWRIREAGDARWSARRALSPYGRRKRSHMSCRCAR